MKSAMLLRVLYVVLYAAPRGSGVRLQGLCRARSCVREFLWHVLSERYPLTLHHFCACSRCQAVNF